MRTGPRLWATATWALAWGGWRGEPRPSHIGDKPGTRRPSCFPQASRAPGAGLLLVSGTSLDAAETASFTPTLASGHQRSRPGRSHSPIPVSPREPLWPRGGKLRSATQCPGLCLTLAGAPLTFPNSCFLCWASTEDTGAAGVRALRPDSQGPWGARLHSAPSAAPCSHLLPWGCPAPLRTIGRPVLALAALGVPAPLRAIGRPMLALTVLDQAIHQGCDHDVSDLSYLGMTQAGPGRVCSWRGREAAGPGRLQGTGLGRSWGVGAAPEGGGAARIGRGDAGTRCLLCLACTMSGPESTGEQGRTAVTHGRAADNFI